MKASHRKDVIIARIIFAIICAALLAGIISLIVWLHGRNAGKNQTPETEITNNAPPADNSNLPPVTEQPLRFQCCMTGKETVHTPHIFSIVFCLPFHTTQISCLVYRMNLIIKNMLSLF